MTNEQSGRRTRGLPRSSCVERSKSRRRFRNPEQLGTPDFTANVVRCSMSVRRYSLNFAPRPTPRGRDGKELIQCPTSSCDGMGHVSGNYATHRRQGNIDVYSESLTLDYVYIDIWRCSTHARTLHTRTRAYIHVHLDPCWPPPLFWLLKRDSYAPSRSR